MKAWSGLLFPQILATNEHAVLGSTTSADRPVLGSSTEH
jgi:hypothetical protein